MKGTIVGIILSFVLPIHFTFSAEIRKAPSDCIEDLNQIITPTMQRARQLFEALTGTPIAYCDERLKRIDIYLKAHRYRDATRVAIADPDFYNIRIREMASEICTREHSKRTPVNDCIAFFVGAVRDGVDVREFLTGNFWYRIDTGKVTNGVEDNLVSDILRSNDHYDEIDEDELSMFHVLKRVDGQLVIDSVNNNRAIAARDPAGVLTTRAWMFAHANAGTNRRLVEQSFEQFLCTPIRNFSDNSIPDIFVGRDVDRRPGDEPNAYLVTCKGCHAPMDSMRSAFAHVDWDTRNGGFFRYDPTRVVEKMNRNADTTPNLTFLVTNNSYDNLALTGANATQFGWRGFTVGRGIKEFGQMIANSQAYNKCLVKRVFKTVCGRDADSTLQPLIDTYASDFDRRVIRDVRVLFERIALRPECTAHGPM